MDIALLDALRVYLDGETSRAATEIAGELVEVLEQAGWVFVGVPEPGLRRVIATLLQDGNAVDLRYMESVASEP